MIECHIWVSGVYLTRFVWRAAPYVGDKIRVLLPPDQVARLTVTEIVWNSVRAPINDLDTTVDINCKMGDPVTMEPALNDVAIALDYLLGEMRNKGDVGTAATIAKAALDAYRSKR